MGAIPVSPADERRIVSLGRKLGVRSKAGVVRLAIEELDRRVERGRVGAAIREYVEKHGETDRRENAALSAGGVVPNDR